MIYKPMFIVERLWFATIPKNSKSKILKSTNDTLVIEIYLSNGSQRIATGMV